MIRSAVLRKYANDIRGAARFGFSHVACVTYPIDCFEDDLAPLVARLLEDEADRMERGPSPLSDHDAAVAREVARRARKISGAE